MIASYPVADATTNSIMWQGCQVFGIVIVLVMDLLRDSNGVPKDNMYRALILQAAFAGVMVLLCFTFRGRMRRTEAIEELKRLEEEEEKNEKDKVVELEEVEHHSITISDE